MVILVTLAISISMLFDTKWCNHLIMPLLIFVISVIAKIIVAGAISIIFSIDL